MKRAFKMKKKAFFVIFNGLFIEANNRNFLEDESPTLKVKQITSHYY